jgi:TRAP-type C4-dicarboxylate transport system permease large subunit
MFAQFLEIHQMFHLILVLVVGSIFVGFFTSRSTNTLLLFLVAFLCLYLYLYTEWNDVELVTARGGGVFGVILMIITPVYIMGVLLFRAFRKK